MATYLELVKDLARESGTAGGPDAITTVSGLSGRPAKLANWIKQAYINIQISERDWGWLTATFTAPLIPGTAVYTAASFALTRFAAWSSDRDGYYPFSIYDPAIGLSDERELPQITHEQWRARWGRGDQSSPYWNTPVEWAISPRKELEFGPYPDGAYVIRGQYQKGPQELVNNTDVPEMPERFHQLIVWEGLRLMMLHDGAYDEAAFPTIEVARLRHLLDLDQLPEIVVP